MSSSSSSDAAAHSIISRIRERSLQLEAENEARQIAQEELNRVEQQLQQATQWRNQQRRAFVHAVQARHFVETELWNARERTDTLRDEIGQNHQQTALATQELENVQQEWEESVRDVYAHHKVRMLLYQRFVEQHVRNKEERQQRRRNKIRAMMRQAERLAEKERQMKHEARVLATKLGEPEFVPGYGAMSATAEAIRAALQEVRRDERCFDSFLSQMCM